MANVVSLKDARGLVDQVGSKAGNLTELARAGFPVPGGFVVTVQSFERFLEANESGADGTTIQLERATFPDDVADEIRSAVGLLGDVPVAVRSSGVAEDLPDASFAGQYETILNVRGSTAILDAVRACWASAFAPRVLSYRSSMGKVGPPRLAVLVQRLVPADAAGVAFTANPMTGDRHEVVVSAVRGFGERLVAGQASADEWAVRDGKAVCRRMSEGAVPEEQVKAVAALARLVESHYGDPQDIEWALADGELFLLQARPITALPEPATWKAPLPGAWLRNFRLGEWLGDPLTPLFETWLVERLDEGFYGNFERVLHLPTPRPYHVVVNGWYFATANFLPATRSQMVALFFRHFLPGFILRPRKMSILTASKAYWGFAWFEHQWRDSIRPRYRSVVAVASRRVEAASPEELVGIVEELARAAGESYYAVGAVAGSAWKPEYVLAKFYLAHLFPKIRGSHQGLLQGLGGTLSSATGPHVLSLDWSQPSLEELGSLLREEGTEDRFARARAERRKVETAAWEALKNAPRLRRKFERLLATAQHAAQVREEQTAEFTLAWPVMRRALLRLGGHLVGQGTLGAPEDVFFLTREELVAAIPSATPAKGLATTVAARRLRWQRQRRLAPPVRIGVMAPMAERMLERFERTLAADPGEKGGLVQGMPASPGRAVGPVRVIRSVEEFTRLRPGEILVAPMTNPAWTPLFARAAAVVTDTGSLMAHASLVAREYGIPAVVGTGDGTARLRDGMVVAVDGNRGLVERVEGSSMRAR